MTADLTALYEYVDRNMDYRFQHMLVLPTYQTKSPDPAS